MTSIFPDCELIFLLNFKERYDLNLIQKYAPTSIEEMVGNTDSLQLARDALERSEKVWYIYGEFGCGKTTLANILGCLITEEPVCSYSTKKNPYITEIQGGKVEQIEEMIDMMKVREIKPKVFILNEVDGKSTGLTQQAQVKLKPVTEGEMGNNYVIYTGKTKKGMHKDLLSRCTQIKLDKIDNLSFLQRLQYICEQEGSNIGLEVLRLIIQRANGHLRDGIKELEIVIGKSGEEALRLLGKGGELEETEPNFLELPRILLYTKQSDWGKLVNILKTYKTSNTNSAERVRLSICTYMRKVIMDLDRSGIDTCRRAVYILKMFSQDIMESWDELFLVCSQIFFNVG